MRKLHRFYSFNQKANLCSRLAGRATKQSVNLVPSLKRQQVKPLAHFIFADGEKVVALGIRFECNIETPE